MCFYLAFNLTFHWKISKIFRKYSFFGILIIMVMEGNIEQFTFYLLGELTIFFSACFTHRIVNIFIVFFFYLVFTTGFAIFIFFKICYKKHLNKFIENSKANWVGMIGYTIDRGVICIIFGAAHQLLLSLPDYQILTLSLI